MSQVGYIPPTNKTSKYRKKPIEVEAYQYFGSGFEICTLEGNMKVNDTDYIITGIAGEKYPCRADIFEKTYDRIYETLKCIEISDKEWDALPNSREIQ